MRGDRPDAAGYPPAGQAFTPHARGSTLYIPADKTGKNVYPACAGIDHDSAGTRVLVGGLPRMRGDRPLNVKDSDSRQEFTPHARGSTH